MTTHIALLRGINVGPGRAVPMADLRALCTGLGWADVATYIQSGNLVFGAEGNPDDLARTLEVALAARYPFAIPVLVRTAAQWQTLAADRPFGGWSDPKQLSVTLLGAEPDPADWAALAPWKDDDDEVELIGDRVWVKSVTAGYGKTKFHNSWIENKLHRKATTRNRATVEALLAMLSW